MLRNFNFLPKWVVILIDLLVCYFSFIFAFFVKNEFSLTGFDLHTNSGSIILWLSILLISFITFKTYSGIIRYTGMQDILRLAYALFSTIALLFLISLFGTFFKLGVYFSVTSLVYDFFCTLTLLILYRLIFKWAFLFIRKRNDSLINVLIYGGAEDGIAIKRLIESNSQHNLKIRGFVDDELRNVGKSIDGIRIYHIKELEEILQLLAIDELILANTTLSLDKKKKIIEFCFQLGIKVLEMKPIDQWILGEKDSLKPIEIDILSLIEEGNEIKSDVLNFNYLNGKKIFISGAGGSIAHELIKLIIDYKPKALILLDHNENSIYSLQSEFSGPLYVEIDIIAVLGDIENENILKSIFLKYQPDIVFHAAAVKQIPICETSILKTFLTNIRGTKIIADLAKEFKVEKFVFLSNNKAYLPNNVLNLSKRIGELYLLSLSQSGENNTNFILIRLGNVIGSNGSVSELFREQIKSGGPLKITNLEMSRSFITILSCAKLILHITSYNLLNQIYTIKMGSSMSIKSLGEQMIKLYGYKPGIDIRIETSGLRAGERLYEELWKEPESEMLSNSENILIVKPSLLKNTFDTALFLNLINLLENGDDENIVHLKMKELIPEFYNF